jgi:ABC-type multidrug transport system ATPase subunit/ABC-type multidrug transport system permease subunit
VLFFIPFCLVLLGLSSLHCWRDERILLLHEKSYKLIYGFSAYFISAILFDVVFVRILPPTFFALISYRMIGLNQGCNYCLLTFALILVLTNMISSLMAMVVGAFHFSLPTAQLIGVVITLYFALFSGYLVNKKSVGQSGFLSLISTDPLSYSFEALLINQFGSQSDEDGNEVYYFINGSMCAPSLPTTLSSGDMILGTFGFEDKEHALRTDILALAFVALIYLVLTFGVSISSVSDLLKRCTRFCTARNHFRTQTNESLDPRDDEIRGNLLSHVDDLHEEGVATNMPLEDLLEEHLGRNSAANLVLSFHDISLCVPSNGECRTSYENVGSILEQKISTIVESRDTNLGISVEKDPESGLGRLAQILPGSWAQRQGLLVGDVVVAVGGITITASDDLFVVLEGSLCPFSIEVLRGRKYKSDFFASRQAQEVPTESNCTNTNCSTPFYGDLKLDEDPAVPISEPCGNRTWILRGVSGSTISSKYYNDMTQLSHSRIVSMPHMLTALLGPSGKFAKKALCSYLLTQMLLSSITFCMRTSKAAFENVLTYSLPHMSSSGSGKTSLLDILSGRKTVGTFTGSVRINGKIMTSSDMRSLSGYVIQEDILPGPLSVRECLRFQAQLRVLGSPSTITQRVNDVLERMELHSHQEQIIGTALHRGLSGGEKRRLSVAIELLSKPAILFCDEPTTGLDSHSALSLCRILEDVARSGTTVIISIHQPGPEILKLITQAIFMTRDGRVCFSGPGEKLENYLVEYSRYTPIDEGCHADAMLNEISSCNQDALVKAFKASRSGQAEREVLAFLSNLQQNSRQLKCGEDLIESRGKHIAPWTTQFRHLSYRTMRYSMRNPFPFILHGITAVAAALILGLAFHDISKFNEETAGVQNRFGIMFFLVLYLSLLALTSLSIWREDQRLFVVERGSGIYCTSSYLSATFLFDVLPYRMLPPLAFTLIAYPMIGLNDVSSGHRWIFFAVLLASNLTFSSICMLVGTLARSNASANAAGSLTMLTSILFCGFLFSKRDMPWLLWYILRWSPGSYAFESLVVNEMSGLKDLYITTTISHSEARAGPFSGEEISGCFGFTGGVRFNLVTLFIMAGVYFIGVFFVMKKFTKEVR